MLFFSHLEYMYLHIYTQDICTIFNVVHHYKNLRSVALSFNSF